MAKQYIDGINIIAPKNEYAKGRVVINLNQFMAFAKKAVDEGWSNDVMKDGEPVLKKDGTAAQCLWMDLKESKAGDLYLEQWKPDAPSQPETEVYEDDIPF